MTTCVQACATGSTDVNEMCVAEGTTAGSVQMQAALGYGAYVCNLFDTMRTTCGCFYNYPGVQCANLSPPPSPPPPSPPPPSPEPPLAGPPAGFPWCACTARDPALSPYSITRVAAPGRKLLGAAARSAAPLPLRRLLDDHNYTILADSDPEGDDPALLGVPQQVRVLTPMLPRCMRFRRALL